MWVRFTDDYSWHQPAFTIAYKAGWSGNIPHDAAEAAIAAGKAVRLRKTHKDEEPQEWQSAPEAANSTDA